jgi:hypothetical protein
MYRNMIENGHKDWNYVLLLGEKTLNDGCL